MTRKSPTSQNLNINLTRSLIDILINTLVDTLINLILANRPGPEIKSVPPQPGPSQAASYDTGQLSQDTPTTSQPQLKTQSSTSSHSSAYGPTGQEVYPPVSGFPDLIVPKRPAHVSVAIPPDGWLCEKLERFEARPLKDVFCHLASLVPSVHTIGHPQKKGFKSHSVIEKNKVCQKCFLCRSMSLSPRCKNVPSVLTDLPITGVLGSLARDGCKSSGSIHFKGGLHHTFQNDACF